MYGRRMTTVHLLLKVGLVTRILVLACKLQESHIVEVRSVRSSHVVVDDGKRSSMLPLFQVVLNSTRPIEDELT